MSLAWPPSIVKTDRGSSRRAGSIGGALLLVRWKLSSYATIISGNRVSNRAPVTLTEPLEAGIKLDSATSSSLKLASVAMGAEEIDLDPHRAQIAIAWRTGKRVANNALDLPQAEPLYRQPGAR